MVKASLILNLLISLQLIHLSIQLEPFITEYIIPFDLPVDDLKNTASNQLSRNQFKTNNFTTDNVTVSKLIFKSTYNGTGKIVDPKEQSIFHTVWNDSIDLTVTYQADIHKLPTTKKTFNGTTKLKVYVNYTKRLIIENDTTEIVGVVVVVDKNSFVMSYTGNPNDSQKKKLDQINNGVVTGKKNTTIFSLLQTQEITKELVSTFFKENLVNQKISPTYQSTYNYRFSKINATFDMTTSGIKTIPHGIAHYLKATIKNFQSILSSKQINAPYEQGYHTLFSIDFLDYFMRYNTQKNPDWVSQKINKDTIRTRIFKFRLIDLQFLFKSLTTKYAQFYLNYISMVCTPKGYDNWQFDEDKNKIAVSMVWHCQGFIDGSTPSALILDFDATLNYQTEIRLYSDMLEVYVTQTDLVALDFQPLDDEPIQDPELALIYGNEISQDLRGYTAGSSFKLKANSSKILLKKDVGIYVG